MFPPALKFGTIAGSDRPIISDLAPIPSYPEIRMSPTERQATPPRRLAEWLAVDDSRNSDYRSLERLIAERCSDRK
jgi:hypothetical protein